MAFQSMNRGTRESGVKCSCSFTMSRSFDFFFQSSKKISFTARFIMPNFVDMSFIRIGSKLIEMWVPKLDDFYTEGIYVNG